MRKAYKCLVQISVSEVLKKINMNLFHIDRFRHGLIEIEISTSPVSAQSKLRNRQEYKQTIQSITSASDQIIVGTCWVAIDYYCQQIKRLKNPGVYDMDNIIKPTLDSLVGPKGLILDDVLVDRVTVNWVDTHKEDYLVLELRYPDLIFLEKSDLKIIKSDSGWCFPISSKLLDVENISGIIRTYFEKWDSITTESDYIQLLPFLPQGHFVYFSKIKDRGYDFIALEDLS